MDSFEWNKIAGGILGTILFVMVLWMGVESVFEVHPLAKPAYVVEGVEEHAAPEAGAAAPAEEKLPDFGTVLATASVEKGATVAERCAVCHDWSKGGPHKIGPNLHSVVERAKASAAGFDFSPPLKAKGGTWTYADLFIFLKQPAVFAPGNKMAFAGLPREQDRLDLIAFLRTQADTPAALPAAQPAAEAAAP